MKKQFLYCSFDGFKLRITDDNYVRHVRENHKKFDLQQYGPFKRDLEEEEVRKELEEKLPCDGIVSSYKIREVRYRKKKAIEICGSFYKNWYNGENYKPFYWRDFLKAYQEFLGIFDLHEVEVEVINLEIGINIPMSKLISLFPKISAYKIISNILFYKAPSNRHGKNLCHYKRFGLGWYLIIEEYWIKNYVKMPKDKKVMWPDTLRLEKKHTRRDCLQKLGVNMLEDLLNPTVINELIDDFLKYQKRMIIYQDEFEEAPLTPDEMRFLLKFNRPTNWDNTHIETKSLKETKKRYKDLVSKYCDYNLKDELLRVAGDLLKKES